MPLTMLDTKTALIVVDLQKGLAGRVPASLFAPVVERSRALADAFRAHGLPVVLVTADGVAPGRADHPGGGGVFPPDFAEVLDEIGEQPGDIRVVKRTWGAFTRTGLDERLRGLGVTQVAITGVATAIGVESTARQAHEAGFNVSLPVDAMADLNAEAHERSVIHIFPRLGETGSTADLIALLDRREPGRA